MCDRVKHFEVHDAYFILHTSGISNEDINIADNNNLEITVFYLAKQH